MYFLFITQVFVKTSCENRHIVGYKMDLHICSTGWLFCRSKCSRPSSKLSNWSIAVIAALHMLLTNVTILQSSYSCSLRVQQNGVCVENCYHGHSPLPFLHGTGELLVQSNACVENRHGYICTWIMPEEMCTWLP